jgi:hypothetical protein
MQQCAMSMGVCSYDPKSPPPPAPRYGPVLSAVPQVLRIAVEKSLPDGTARHVTGTWHGHQ